MNYLERIEINPKIMAGKPVIRGTRIPVDLILEKLAQNVDLKELFEDYPRLSLEDIKAVLMYARKLVQSSKANNF